MLVYRGSGVATYTYNLVKNLLNIDKENTYHLFYSSLRRPTHFPYLNEFKSLGGRIIDYPFPPLCLKFCWNRHELFPCEWFMGKVDVFHSSDFLRPPLLKGTKGVTTIHDLTWKIFPQFHTLGIVKAHERKLQKTIKYNDMIIVDSPQTKNDLFQYYPKIKNTVTTIPLGVDEIYFQKLAHNNIQLVLTKYYITSPYILYVGAIEPRKNIQALVRAFHTVSKLKPELRLVLAGRAGWKNKKVFENIQRLGLNNRIIFTGYVEDKDLPALYQGASVFVYPSLYEGFGLPPLESIASGTPTISYNSPSISQQFVRKISPDNLSKNILELLKYPTVPKIKLSRWNDTAKQTLDVYKKLL